MPFTNATLQRIVDGVERLAALHGPASASLFLQWKDAETIPDPMPSSRLDSEAEPVRRVCMAAVNAIVCFARACQHAEAGRPLAAWPLIADAEHWAGCSFGLYRAARKDSPEATAAAFAAVAEHLVERNRNAADKGHARDREAKADALRLYAEHAGRRGYRSKTEAAGTIADIVHRSRDTVRRWLTKA